nr:hypothetical protein [Campylobacterota bacterium]
MCQPLEWFKILEREEENGMSYFSNEERFVNLISESKKVDFKDKKFLISGNFHGIQKFIFENLSTKNASKVIRAKSAFVEIFTLYMARYICNRLVISENDILSTNAGKFEILTDDIDISILKDIQKKVDDYFIETFFGLSGLSIFYVECREKDFTSKDAYKKLRNDISQKEEEEKFCKFSLISKKPILTKYESNLTNQTLCKVCNFRKIVSSERCQVCDGFIKLGEALVSTKKELLSSKLGIDTALFDGFDTTIELSDKLKSYVQKDGKEIATFENLAQSSCKNEEDGVKALAILKADVDNMGRYLKESS